MKNLILLLLWCGTAFSNEAVISFGERLFNDARFSHVFYEVSAGDVNDEVIATSKLETVSCSSCHMVDQAFEDEALGAMRGYNDFAKLTPVPLRDDEVTTTLRNTPSLVGIGSKYAQNRFSHYDGEFHDHAQTVLGNFTGRNMGWKKSEKTKALNNIISVIKNDNGKSDLAQEFGGAYAKILLGVDPSIPDDFRLPEAFRIDVFKASDQEILDIVVNMITAYMNSLDFETDDDGVYTGSTYDDFLKLNSISREPGRGQSIADYTLSLIKEFSALKNPSFVKAKYFETHKKSFKFEEQEWRGLKLFFNLSALKSTSRGMCLNCHMPPMFTDQEFHNVGVTQTDYDSVHGAGTFQKLSIPSYKERLEDEYYLSHPTQEDSSKVDLGMWNFFGRTGKEQLTQYFTNFLCPQRDCTKEQALDESIGRIKTPSLRNLNHSEPYFHHGKMKTLTDVLDHYQKAAQLMRKGELRNGATQLRMLSLTMQDKEDLAAFLTTLNSDYE